MLCIGIHALTTHCIIGIRPWERIFPQKLIANISLYHPEQNSTQDPEQHTDSFIDYTEIEKHFLEHCTQNKFLLLESLVSKFRDRIIQAYPFICSMKVEVQKPGALSGKSVAFVQLNYNTLCTCTCGCTNPDSCNSTN